MCSTASIRALCVERHMRLWQAKNRLMYISLINLASHWSLLHASMLVCCLHPSKQRKTMGSMRCLSARKLSLTSRDPPAI